MPVYEYECPKCAHRFEIKRRFSENGASACCPHCKGEARRIIFPTPIVFKGPGFYVTDSRSNHGHSAEPGKTSKTSKTEAVKKSESK